MTITEDEKKGALNVLLNQQPPARYVAMHPYTKTPYIPIEKIEFLMTNIFGNWDVEIKRETLIANSICVTVKVSYTCPLTTVRMSQDGVGAAPLITDKGCGATDFQAIKNDSVQKALPAAESYAIKDACQKIGTIFGKDLGRKTTSNYDNMMPETVKEYTFDKPQLTEK